MAQVNAFTRISAAGFAATAIAFGPGRMGFGLFLPEFREAFALSSGAAGAISGAGFAGFFAGLLASYSITALKGPKTAILAGLCLAAAGAAIVAQAEEPVMLTLGVVLSMSSAGFAWTPFNLLAHRHVSDTRRPATLSVVSTGTSLGVAAAGASALVLSLADLSWRVAWAGFAAAALLACLWCHLALRPLPSPGHVNDRLPVGALKQSAAVPLALVALSFGASTSVFISFAADRIVTAGGLGGVAGGEAAPLIFMIYGVAGLAGLATGSLRARIGLRPLLSALLVISALSHLSVAFFPASWTAVIIAAAAQGVFVMSMSAVLSFWSERLFPAAPALGFTVTLLAVAAGSAVAPPLAGSGLDALGAGIIFAAVAGLSLASLAATLTARLHERGAAA